MLCVSFSVRAQTQSRPALSGFKMPPLVAESLDNGLRVVVCPRAQCSPGNYPRVVSAVRQTVTSLSAAGMQEQDLITARNILLSSRQISHQTAAVRARMLATAGQYGLPADSERRYREGAAMADLEQVNRTVKSMLEGESLLLLLWPEGIERP